MITLIGFLRTFVTVRNPLNGLPYEGRKKIKFYNRLELKLSFPQFRDIRDCYSVLKKFTVQQVGEDSFKVDFKSFNITASAANICLIATLVRHFEVNLMVNEKFQIKGNGFKLEGSLDMLGIVKELFLDGEYEGDYTGKVVLDIGGFQGESAVYFWHAGAKKVVIYEPIKDYYEQIRVNLKLNNIPSEINQAGIGPEDTKMTIDVFAADDSKQELVDMKNISEVITLSCADVAKIDCEGAEICLTSVPNKTLRKIPHYEIELHGVDVQDKVLKKFEEAGFKVTRYKKLHDNVSLASCKRVDNQ
jgi:FkbM family methyltransferase